MPNTTPLLLLTHTHAYSVSRCPWARLEMTPKARLPTSRSFQSSRGEAQYGGIRCSLVRGRSCLERQVGRARRRKEGKLRFQGSRIPRGLTDQGLGVTPPGALGKGSCCWKAASGVWSAGRARRWGEGSSVACGASKVRSPESHHGRALDVG